MTHFNCSDPRGVCGRGSRLELGLRDTGGGMRNLLRVLEEVQLEIDVFVVKLHESRHYDVPVMM